MMAYSPNGNMNIYDFVLSCGDSYEEWYRHLQIIGGADMTSSQKYNYGRSDQNYVEWVTDYNQVDPERHDYDR
jgi:hypothetical protein